MAYEKLGAGGVAVLGGLAIAGAISELSATLSPVVYEERTFTETTGAGVYTASVNVPAGASLIDVIIQSTALWTATASATPRG